VRLHPNGDGPRSPPSVDSRPALWWILFSILRMFGRYSYGLSLDQFPLKAVLEPLKPMILGRLGLITAGSVVYLATCQGINLPVAAPSFRFIESPILNLKSRFRYL